MKERERERKRERSSADTGQEREEIVQVALELSREYVNLSLILHEKGDGGWGVDVEGREGEVHRHHWPMTTHSRGPCAPAPLLS